jgi:hypothetical protein
MERRSRYPQITFPLPSNPIRATSALRRSANIRRRARGLGELIRKQKETVGLATGGGDTSGPSFKTAPQDPPTLAEVGISYKLATVSEKHIPEVVNLPLHELGEKISTIESDKSQVILCHWMSGGRSAIAMSRLRKLGYSQAYNLGSYGQAAAVLKN